MSLYLNYVVRTLFASIGRCGIMTVLLVRLCMLLNKYLEMSNLRWNQPMILRKLNVKLTLWKVSLMIWITVLTITLQNLYRRCRMALLGLRLYISAELAQLRDRLRNIVSTLMDAWVSVRLLAVRLGQSLGLM